MSHKLTHFLICSSLVCSAFSAQSSESHYDESYLEINQYSPLETFESHGTYGWHLGVGASQGSSSPQSTDQVPSPVPQKIPRLFLNKGTRWPVDLGVSFAHLQQSRGTWQVGGHLQWVLWEAFRQPTLALRISRIESRGLDKLEKLRNDGLQIGSSYAPLHFLTLSAAVGYQKHQFQWVTDEEELALSRGINLTTNKHYMSLSWGAKLQLFSPFWSLAFEQIRTNSASINLGKLSLVL